MSLRPRRVDFDSTWKLLLETVKGVITCGSIQRATWNDRFSDVYALCVAYPEPLGDKLYQETKRFLETYVTQLHTEVSESGEETLLKSYNDHWADFSRGSDYLNQLYSYLNIQYIKKQRYSEADINYGGFVMDVNEQMLEIGELALDTWRRLMIDPLKDVLLSQLLKQIHQDRLGGSVNQGVVHGVINSFCDVERYKKKNKLKLYEDYFESAFLGETGDYYRQVAQTLLELPTCSEYIEKVIQRLDEEDYRSRKFLVESSYSKVTRECENRLVTAHLEYLNAECKEIVKKEKLDDLRRMYRLLCSQPNNGLSVMTSQVEEHIREAALREVQGLKGENVPAQFVENLLEVHGKYTELIQDVFKSDQQFTGALDKACAAAINYKTNPKQHCKSPEILVKYCDALLKKSAKGLTETEVDDKLTACIVVFKYLDDKDVFQRFYARMLAKRLIYGQSQSMDAEEGMINRLKQACGYQFTNKLYRMFTDMTLSSDLNTKFGEYLKKDSNKTDLGVNFSILVLQAGAWPLGQGNLPSFAIPQELERSVKTFETFYASSFNGRKLTWMHNLCNAELKMNHLKKPYIVTMTTFQMSILLPFNSADNVSVKDLLDATSLQEKELIKQAQTLVDAKLVLCQGEVSETSVFTLNTQYSNKRTKFKITAAAQKETPQEVEQAHSNVDEDRQLYIQAAIVRIMKARKILKHNLLIQEVISQSRARFSPSISMIKRCIETLIDKQYLERTSSATDEYSYVA